jgi:hypothetical protein
MKGSVMKPKGRITETPERLVLMKTGVTSLA